MFNTFSVFSPISGSGVWRKVAKEEIPNVQFKQYRELASLEETTRAAIANCKEYPIVPYSKPSQCVSEGSFPLHLYRRVDVSYGTVEHRVVASRDLRPGTAICYIGGKLTETWKIEKHVLAEHGFLLKRDELRTFFDYVGQSHLTILTDQHHNISKYIRDPSTRIRENEKANGSSSSNNARDGANCKPDIYYDPKTQTFFVILYALMEIARGEEIFAYQFLGDWRAKLSWQMFLAGRVSHWLHRYAASLEAVLERAGVSHDGSIEALGSTHLLTEAEKLVHVDENEIYERKRMQEVQARDSCRFIELDEAFRLSGCEHVRESILGASVSEKTRKLLKNHPDVYPAELLIEDRSLPLDRADLDRLLEIGHDAELIEVREVLGITAPARYFTPPWYRAFCVVAKQEIRVGQLLCLYTGEIEEESQHNASSYVYGLPRTDGMQHFGKRYPLPDLLIDGAKKGGIGRFINDNSHRAGKEDDTSSVNVAVTWLYQNGRPQLFFYATRVIAAGDELIATYGSDFWNVMCRQNIEDQQKFLAYVHPYTKKLESLCEENSLSLPDKPDCVIESKREFEPKRVPYDPDRFDTEDFYEQCIRAYEKARKSKGAQTIKKNIPPQKAKSPQPKKRGRPSEAPVPPQNPGSSQWEVERLLKKRFFDGCWWFLVKWVGFQESENSWEPANNMAKDVPELVSAFEQPIKSHKVEPIDEGPVATSRSGRRLRRSRSSMELQEFGPAYANNSRRFSGRTKKNQVNYLEPGSESEKEGGKREARAALKRAKIAEPVPAAEEAPPSPTIPSPVAHKRLEFEERKEDSPASSSSASEADSNDDGDSVNVLTQVFID